MKKLNIIIAFAILIIPYLAVADQRVNGYTKKDGTYVKPYYRTDSNDTRDDNYSTKGNVNPYTGEKGTKDPDKDSGSRIKKNNW